MKFIFKNFIIFHDRCAMKVGTDGTLLGAWASVEKADNVLDIGTGTGLIALIVAQRNGRAIVHGVELDNDSFTQALTNVKQSIYHKQIKLFNCAIQDYSTELKYDAIICNPPFYNSSKLPENERLQIAKHDKMLSVGDLFSSVGRMLNEDGVFSVIFPTSMYEVWTDEAFRFNLFPLTICKVYTKQDIPSKRILATFTNKKNDILESTLIIQDATGKYTQDYQKLTRAFYL